MIKIPFVYNVVWISDGMSAYTRVSQECACVIDVRVNVAERRRSIRSISLSICSFAE